MGCPPPAIPPVLTLTKHTYQVWHGYLQKLNRIDRYTIGAKIDETFLFLLETIFRSSFAYDKFEKLSFISQSLGKNDLLKFFLQIAWEQKVIEAKQYGTVSLLVDDIGRQLYNWKQDTQERMK